MSFILRTAFPKSCTANEKTKICDDRICVTKERDPWRTFLLVPLPFSSVKVAITIGSSVWRIAFGNLWSPPTVNHAPSGCVKAAYLRFRDLLSGSYHVRGRSQEGRQIGDRSRRGQNLVGTRRDRAGFHSRRV